MSAVLSPHDDGIRRFFIGSVTAHVPKAPELTREELVAELERMRKLFVERLGYVEVAGFGPDLPGIAFRDQLSLFLTDPNRRASDHVVVYHSGHAELTDDDDFLLPFADATQDLTRSSVAAPELARWLLTGTVVRNVMLILDTCQASAAATAVLDRAAALLGKVRGLDASASVVLIAAARPREYADPGAFAQTFVRAIDSWATAGSEPAHLQPDAVVRVLNADARTPSWQHAACFTAGEGSSCFLPNPRVRAAALDVVRLTQLSVRQEKRRAAELRAHFRPRAQGLDAPGQDVWLFTGRHSALRALSRWLADPGDRTSRVVTGSPGSGKSAIIARLGLLSSAAYRPLVPDLEELPADAIPHVGAIDVLIHARGKTPEEVLEALCAASGILADTPRQWLDEIARRERPFVAAIDAVDEAADPLRLAQTLLRPMMHEAAAGVRVLVGTRSTVVQALGGGNAIIDLDDLEFADPRAIVRYGERCLLELVPTSPYRDRPSAYVRDVARAVASAAGHSFLVALIVCRSLALRDAVVDPRDARWHEGLPREAAAAMRDDLRARLGDDAARAEDLLRPLAYARGSGLPWEDLWAALASRMAGRPYGTDDVLWLHDLAGFYIVEDIEAQRSVYRLYHQALADYLTAGTDVVAGERAFTTTLVERVPTTDGQRDFWRAHPYIRAHLATHAAAAGLLDALLLDPSFLLASHRRRLLAALSAARSEDATRAANAFARAVPHLLTKPVADHLAYLQLSAHLYEAAELVRTCRTSVASRGMWSPRWLQWVPASSAAARGHRDQVNAIAMTEDASGTTVWSGGEDGAVIRWQDVPNRRPRGTGWQAHEGAVRVLALADDGERTLLVTAGGDGKIGIWDGYAGRAVRGPLSAHEGLIRSMTATRSDGRPIVLTGGADHVIRSWDLMAGAEFTQPLIGHRGWVNALTTTARADGALLVVSGSSDGTVRVWDLATQQLVLDPLLHDDWVNAVLVTTLGGAPVIVAACSDGMVNVWRLDDGQVACDPVPLHGNWIRGLATAALPDRTAIVTGSTDATARVWDLSVGAAVGVPLLGHAREVRAVAVSAHGGEPIAATASADATLRLWDVASGRPLGAPLADHSARIAALAVMGPERGSWVVAGTGDGMVGVWDARDGRGPIARWRAHADGVSALAVTDLDGRTIIISGGEDGTIGTWDARDGAPLEAPRAAHRGGVTALTPIAGGFASAGADATLAWWKLGRRAAKDRAGAPGGVAIGALARTAGERDGDDAGEGEGEGVIVAGDANGCLFALATGRPRRCWGKRKTVKSTALGVHGAPVTGLVVTSDGHLLAAGGTQLSIHDARAASTDARTHPAVLASPLVIEIDSACGCVAHAANGIVIVGGRALVALE